MYPASAALLTVWLWSSACVGAMSAGAPPLPPPAGAANGVWVEHFDRTRRHMVRVVDLRSAPREPPSDDPEEPAPPGDPDLALRFLLELTEPDTVETPVAPPHIGSYVMRFGGGAAGVDSDVEIEGDAGGPRTLAADCRNPSVPT